MLPVMRFLLAIAVALLLIAGVLGYPGWLKQSINGELRAMFTALKTQGNLPAGFDPQTATVADLQDFDLELPESLRNQLLTYDLIFSLWIVWVPAMLLVCLGTAFFLPRGTAPLETGS
jgi:hypothetical protein